MSSDFSTSQKSTATLLSQDISTERNTYEQEQKVLKLIEETLQVQQQDQEKQKKNGCFPSHFQQLRLRSMDLGTTEIRETKLQQYNAHIQEVQDLLNQERLYLTQPGVQQMAIKIFKKQLKSKLEVQFIYKLMQSMEIFEQNTEIMSQETVTRDLVKYFQISFFKKHHKLFDIDQYGDKFYIILSGSVYCLIPDPEKLKTVQKLTNNFTNDLENVLKSKNQAIAKIVKAQSDRPRRNSGAISAMSSIIDLDSSRFETKDEQEAQFIEQNYPLLKMAKIMQQGEAFGEIALLSEDNKRTAAVVFREDSWVLSLSKSSFDQIMGNYKINVLEENLQFLKTFEFFNNIPNQRLLGLLHSMTTHSYNKKTILYTEKDPNSHIFFLKNGNVEISKLQNTFEQGSSQQIPSSSSSKNLNQNIKIRRKANSQSIHINFDDYKLGKSKHNTSIKPINTDNSESEHNTSLNNSLKDKENQITCFMTKERNKSQKRIAIASLGKGSYFGEDEILIHPNPKRISQAVCQSGKTEIFSIEKKKLFDILKEYGQKERFTQDAKVRNEMREDRINKMLDNERESKLYSTSYKYYQKNYVQMESEKLINIPNHNKQQEQSLYFSSKNIQTQSISSQSSVGQMAKTCLQIPSNSSSSNITTTIGNSTTQINNISTNTSTQLYQPYRRPSMTFVLDEVEKSEEFQKIYQKKKKIMEAKNNVKLFTMKKDQYVFTINKILKEGNFNLSKGSLPHLQEKFQFQQTDHTKKSGKMNKYNIFHSQLKENSNSKENQNILLPSECTSPNMSSRFLTPSQQNSKIQQFKYSNNKSSSMHISQACSPTNNHNNIFLSKQKIDSSTIFNSLLQTKQQKFEELLLKSSKKSESKNEVRQFLSPDHQKQQENNQNLKIHIKTKSIYNFPTRVALPLHPSTTKHINN